MGIDETEMNETLERIRKRRADDLNGLMEYIQSIWSVKHYGRCWKDGDGTWHFSTGGWSENEDIVEAMEQNEAWWMMNWYLSKRGGHYEFRKITERE